MQLQFDRIDYLFNIKCNTDFNDVLVYTSDYGRSTDNTLVAAAFDIRNSSWCCAFSYWGECSEVKTISWCSSNSNVSNTLPASLLLNPDKSFKAFGYEAQEHYGRLGDVERAGYYFFQEVMSVFDSQKVCFIYVYIQLYFRTPKYNK